MDDIPIDDRKLTVFYLQDAIGHVFDTDIKTNNLPKHFKE
jgi:hypothetical protein